MASRGVLGRWGGELRARFDASRVAASRRAYTSVSRHPSPAPGFEGMVEEMRWGLVHLPAADRARADHRVLVSIFFGPTALRWLRVLRGRWPQVTTLALARGAPLSLRWLVGEIEVRGPRLNVVPACSFRRTGGADLCERVCRRPTEQFCAEHAAPVRLSPHPDSMACTWTWGATSEDGVAPP